MLHCVTHAQLYTISDLLAPEVVLQGLLIFTCVGLLHCSFRQNRIENFRAPFGMLV